LSDSGLKARPSASMPARRNSAAGTWALHIVLWIASLPVLIPFIALVMSAFGLRDAPALWPSVVIFLVWLSVLLLVSAAGASGSRAKSGLALLTLVAAIALWSLVGDAFTLRHFRFLLEPPRPSLPSFWSALFNSAVLSLSQTAIVLIAASLAGYFLSRFVFPGRAAALAMLLVVHAFPVMTLIIPLFLMIWWAGLLNSLVGVVFVLAAFELPFAIFIMKGFFDAVPREIEMSALADGANRRQAFLSVVLPQVTNGLVAVAVLAFLRGWEEYVFVSVFLVTQPKWVLSLYLF